LFDVVNRTHQDEFTEFTVSGSYTHGVAERALNRRALGKQVVGQVKLAL